jgi:hypothetical protein
VLLVVVVDDATVEQPAPTVQYRLRDTFSVSVLPRLVAFAGMLFYLAIQM